MGSLSGCIDLIEGGDETLRPRAQQSDKTLA